MVSKLKKIIPKDEIGYYRFLHTLHFFTTIIGEIIFSIHFLEIPFGLPIFILLYILALKSLKQLYYSFWTFSSLLFCYYVFSAIRFLPVLPSNPLPFFYFASVLILAFEMYGLYGPIYYPLVNWWEYDFRFRTDLKVLVCLPDTAMVEGRLTDLRRGAGCVVLFDEINVGDELRVKVSGEGLEMGMAELNAVVMSMRRPLPGRGIHYGVKFIFKNSEEKFEHKQFVKYWRRKHFLKTKMRTLEVKS